MIRNVILDTGPLVPMLMPSRGAHPADMTTPTVSVLLPVRDAGRHLRSCLRSLRRQHFADWEAVIVDDGSTDGSGALLDHYAARDPRIRVVHRPARGLVAALNHGIGLCRGRLVARLDADDVMLPDRLGRQVAMLDSNPDLDVASCLVRIVPRADLGNGYRHYEAWLNSLVCHDDIVRERFVESPIAHPTAMVRRAVLVEASGYRDCGWPEDHDLWLRLAARGCRFAKVPEVLYLWREHPRRLTRTDRRYAIERFIACKAHHLIAGPLHNTERVILWGAGQTGRRLLKYLKREAVPIVAVLDIDPKKIGRTLRGYPIVDTSTLPELWQPGSLLLAAVARRGARALIRDELETLTLREGQDYWCVT